MLCKTPTKLLAGGQSLGERVESQLQSGRDFGHSPNGDGLEAPERLVISRTLATHYQRPRPKTSRKRPGGRVMAESTGVDSQALLLSTLTLGRAQVAIPHLDREVLHTPRTP